MDWLYVVMPISGVSIFWPGLIILGVGVGIIGGFFGMGGAWMVTPALNLLGFPMAFAIGTDITHMAGKSLISTMRHGKFGNVDYLLGIIMLIVTVIKKLAFGDPVAGYPTIICTFLLFGGLQLFCTGILGMYLSKTYLEVKHRPVYLVRETEETREQFEQADKRRESRPEPRNRE